MTDKAKLETLNHFFKVQGVSTDLCHEPSEKCEQTAIRAHAIPSGTVLSTMAKNGHVVMLQMRLKSPPPAEFDFKLVGISKATTFTGLCSVHDHDIFRPIDVRLPDLADPSHLFLLAYRAVLREYHVCLQNAWRFQSTYQKRIEVGLSSGAERCDFGMLATDHIANSFECYRYKRQFDLSYLAKDWSKLQHHIIVLKDQRPSIAVSSMFSLDNLDAPETPRVTLSVFPSGEDVVIVFSAITSDASIVSPHIDRILTSDGFFQKYLLSKLILQSCENFVLAPSYYNSMTQDRKNTLCKFFVDTVLDNTEGHEHEYLYLF